MIETYLLTQLFPRFLLQDKNGYGMAKALQAGIDYFLSAARAGLGLIQDYDTMPEWRLDELARELNCLYDYSAPVASKRAWIRDALPYYSVLGTKAGIRNYITGYFDNVYIQEAAEYGGTPFSFRVTLDGDWTPENEQWTRKAIAAAKNVRSVLDALACGSTGQAGLLGTGAEGTMNPFPLCAEENWCGRWPYDDM